MLEVNKQVGFHVAQFLSSERFHGYKLRGC